MANIDAAFGLRPVRHRNGAPYNGAVNPYYVPSGYGTALFIGDPVVKTGSANDASVTVPGGGHFPVGTAPTINKATVGDGNAITGVIVGFAANPDALGTKHLPASTGGIAYVCDDPDVVFEIQADGSLDEDDVGLNAVLIYTNAGSAYTGMSGAELDTGTTTAPAADASYQLTIQRFVNREDVETGANAKVEVKINNHTEAAAALGL